MPKLFIDSDVIVASLLSQKGAAYFLLYQTTMPCYLSNLSVEELRRVAKHLAISQQKLEALIKRRFVTVTITEDTTHYGVYTNDANDAHIVAGAKVAKARFLITYNLKDFKREKIHQELDIIVMKPATFLQYLRSIS